MVAEASDAVWIDVLPSMRGFATRVVQDAAGAGRKAGKAAATEFDKASAGAGKDLAASVSDQLKRVQAEVEKVSGQLVKARDAEADAAGKVRVAEAALQAVRAKSNATDAQKARAEEVLAASQRRLAAAQRVTIGTTARLDQVQADAAARSKVLTEAAERGESAILRLGASLERVDTTRLDNGARSAARFGVSMVKAAVAAAALGSTTPAVAGLSVAVAQAALAGAVLPGVFLAGGVAAGVLKLGLSGVADALKDWGDGEKFAEAVAGLAPAARASLIEVRELRPELLGLRNAVQQGLFNNAAREIESLAKVYLPLLRRDLPGIASEFGYAREQAAGFAATGRTVDDVHLILQAARGTVGDLADGFVPLLQIVRDFGVVGALVLDDVTSGFGGAAAGAAAFVANARATGQIEDWIRTGLDTLAQFGALFGNVFGLINTVLGSAQQEGGGVLDTLVQITGSLLALAQSAQGTQALGAFFGAVHGVVQALLPGLQAVAGAVFAAVIQVAPYLPGVAAGFTAVVASVAPLIPLLTPLVTTLLPSLVELITWLAPALPALVAGFIAFRAALIGFNIIQGIVAFIRSWAAAQWALNFAITANPIGLIIAAVAALVGAIVWIATQTTWFQDLWAVVWDAISTAASWVYDNVLRPAFDGIVAALRWVGDAAVWLWQNAFVPAWEAIAAAAMWLWSNVLQPVFAFIDTAVRTLAAILITVFVTPAVIAFRLLAGVAMWLWQTAIAPAFDAIGAVATWLYQNVITPVVSGVVAYFRMWAAIGIWLWQSVLRPTIDAIGAAFTWLWQSVLRPVIDFVIGYFRAMGDAAAWVWSSVIKPTIDALGAAAMWLWNSAIMPAFDAIKTGLRMLGDAFSWVWNSVIQPAWNALGTGLRWVQENIVRPVFDALKSGVDQVGSAFQSAVDWIGRVWDGLKSKLSGPVNFVINTVYNDGIRFVWNKVAGMVGVAELPYASPVNFAGGGVVPGYAPGRDTVPALLSRGESVLVPELTAAIGPRNILAANYAASGRRGTVAGGGSGVAAFAGGGIVGNLLSWVSGVGDNIVRLWKDPIGTIKASIGSTGWADMLSRAPAKLIASSADWLWAKLKGHFGFSSDAAAAAAGGAGGAPMGWQQMWQIISAQFPSAILTSALRPGDPGYHGKGRAIDIGGPMGAINAWIAKVFPNSTQLIYTPGVNLLHGRPFAYDGPTQADHHDHVHWAFDSGGYLPPGYSTVYNGTGSPEPVLTSEQWAAISSLANVRREQLSVVQNIDARGADADSIITTSQNRLLHSLGR